MKAFILAAGLGTRLRPITNTVPKPLVLIGGKPLLQYHLELFANYGVNDVLINTHYLPEKIEAFVREYQVKNPEIKISLVYEKELLGSAGTLKANEKFFENEENFLVVYGDNLTNINYKKLLNFHLANKGLITIASYSEPHPESKGTIVFDNNKLISKFIEKPKPEQVISNQANAGIYVCNQGIFKYLRDIELPLIDFGKDLFPLLLIKEKIYTYEMDEFLLDIGTLETYEKAQKIIHKITF